MPELKALETALDEDLRPLSLYLWQHGLPHRIAEQAGRQILWVQEPQHAEAVRELHQRMLRGETLPEAPPLRPAPRRMESIAPWRIPVTLIFVVLSIAGFLVATLDDESRYLPWFTFFEYQRLGEVMIFSLPSREYWRLITPIFLHFTLLHIVFNMLWFWDLGRRIELVQGSVSLLIIVLLIGMGSNLAQAMFAQIGVFGGMSGVIYGLLGYSWSWSWLRKDPALTVPTPIVIMMLVWLVVCMVGFTEMIGMGSVANAAHVGGLVMGLFLGGAAALVARRPA